MRIMNEIQWLGEYTMEDFVTEFSKRTPVLMKTLTGTLGCDELHIISGDEVNDFKVYNMYQHLFISIFTKYL